MSVKLNRHFPVMIIAINSFLNKKNKLKKKKKKKKKGGPPTHVAETPHSK